MILDTSYLLDLKGGNQSAFEKAMALYDADIVQRVTMPSVFELYYGASYLDSADERRRVKNLLLMYPLVDLDEASARHAAELLATADRRAGGDSGIDNEDGLIGAIADRLDEPVLTNNADDFERLGVDVERY